MIATRQFTSLVIALALCCGCDRGTEEADVTDPSTSVQSQGKDESSSGSLSEARQWIAAGNFDAARRAIDRHLLQHPDDPVGLEMSGDGAIQANDYAKASQCYQAAVSSAKAPSKELWFKWAGATIKDGRPFDTIAILRDAIQDYPDDLKIRQNLASLLGRVGLQIEAAEHLQWLVQRKHGSQSVLLQLSDLTVPQTHDETCQAALLRNPSDLRPVFSLAQKQVAESNWQEIRDALAPVVSKHADFVPALALYGRALVELDDAVAVEAWRKSLPAEIKTDSQYWMAAGNWAYRHGDTQQAARAYWSAVQLNENDAEALQGLSASLTRLGRKQQAELAASRAQKIAALRSHIATLVAWDFDSQKAVIDLALSLQELGRCWEATNWLMIGHSMTQHPDSRLEQTFRVVRSALTGATPWQQPEQLVSTRMDLSSFPKVAWNQTATDAPMQDRKNADVVVRFRDEAQTRSLRHVCAIGTVNQESGLMIYQSGAGGVGVIDFDLDGWPDTYLTVMNGTPRSEDSNPNRLHRNLSGEFRDATDNSALIDHGFAQGISVGDYNSDGWPDVFVANIGQNRLYRNNGDGTFQEVTKESKLDGTGWTTSVAIADLNGDGHADIFEVGYCQGEEPLIHKCVVQAIGEARSCNPIAFDSEPDRVWAGNGNGTFSAASDWLGPHEKGRGFALVIGDLDRQSGLETYVANDMTANHFWGKPADAKTFRLTEQASVRGLAFNRRSNAQASMGIAAADADNDGDIDFLLTHFVDDYNTFYQQFSDGVWADESRTAGFVESSKPLLAYGTQWIDVDNDGQLEVFIANGDIDDYAFEGRPLRQPTQLLQQNTGRHWQVLRGDQIGDYFTKNRAARAVATLDANRDGLSDMLVTHLFDPVALLINRTETASKQTRFFVRARATHRDAIGTRVRFTIDDQTHEQQLLAGNGFQCVNEPCIVFGISGAPLLQEVQVIWPGGTTESLGDLKANGDYLVIEGQGPMRMAALQGSE